MKIHYFQRYHQGENVATANTMLLLSRLYAYSPDKFFQFLKEQYFPDIDFDPELAFELQPRGKKSVPDAVITQPSFKLVIEAKLTDWFYEDQLIRHLEKFNEEGYKALITISSEPMDSKKKEEIDKSINEYNNQKHTNILHVNTTFESLAQGVQEVLHERDYDMQDVLDDYLEYCRNDGLIIVSDAWKKMRMQLAGTTFDFNVAENLYYDNIDRGFSAHDYLGLYRWKSIRAIGKIVAIVTAVSVDGKLQYEEERGELTEERKQMIDKAIEDGKRYGYDLNATRYFFVDKFYETDYKKSTKRPPMGSRVFDLTEVLQIAELPETEEIAKQLRNLTWE